MVALQILKTEPDATINLKVAAAIDAFSGFIYILILISEIWAFVCRESLTIDVGKT
jgi:hypothetical protein